MNAISLHLRHDIRDWIESKIEKGEFASAADYLSELVERDRESRSEEERIGEIRQMIAESEASGVSDMTLDDIFEAAVAQAKAAGVYRE
ncbi:MAG: type II toxin-antitoxin system ParD family antitoxin [Rhizobiaceae bacterium]|nr:type II toxin-antitoxin system ParD family antitoxin [Rhizobiaceae bacterium]